MKYSENVYFKLIDNDGFVINEIGQFAQRVFRHCQTKEDFIQFIEFLGQGNHLMRCGNYKDVIFPKKGFLVYNKSTLMRWGMVYFTNYTDKAYNNLCRNGYIAINNYSII